MDSVNHWLFPETPVRTLIAIRPLSISILEKHGIQPFAIPSRRIGEICKVKGLFWTEFLAEIRDLKVPDRDTEWSRLPLMHLLDFLTQEHRQFTREFLPAIKNAIADGQGGPEFLARMHFLIREWPKFAASLTEHITVEESFLFPKILRYDYCSRHVHVDPAFSDGSVKVFAAMELLRNEKRQMGAIRDFLEATAYSVLPFKDSDAAGLALSRLLETFQSRLLEHSRVEREVLYPVASGLEKRLYDRLISGGSGAKAASTAFCPV